MFNYFDILDDELLTETENYKYKIKFIKSALIHAGFNIYISFKVNLIEKENEAKNILINWVRNLYHYDKNIYKIILNYYYDLLYYKLKLYNTMHEIEKNCILSKNFMLKHIDSLDWINISTHQILNDNIFDEQFIDKIRWEYALSKGNFTDKFKKKNSISIINYFKCLFYNNSNLYK